MAEMKLDAYKKYFEAKGVVLSPSLLNRHKKAIYHIGITEDYLAKRLTDGDAKWWEASVSGSRLEDNYAKADLLLLDGVIKVAQNKLTTLLKLPEEADRMVRLAEWMDLSLGATGLAKIRNALNARLASLSKEDGEKIVRLPIMSSTRDSLAQIIDEVAPDKNYDQMIRQIISYYANMHAIKLSDNA